MISSGKFLSTIVTQMDGGKKGILTNEAPTIVEKYKNPKFLSKKVEHKKRFFESGGKEDQKNIKESVYEKESGTDKSKIFSKISKAEIVSAAVKEYNKSNKDRFTDYSSPKSPKNEVKKTDYIAEVIDEMDKEEEQENPSRIIGGEYGQTITITADEMPEIEDMVVGDKACFEVEACISNYDYSKNEFGQERKVYTLRIKKAKLEKYAMEDSEEWE